MIERGARGLKRSCEILLAMLVMLGKFLERRDAKSVPDGREVVPDTDGLRICAQLALNRRDIPQRAEHELIRHAGVNRSSEKCAGLFQVPRFPQPASDARDLRAVPEWKI